MKYNLTKPCAECPYLIENNFTQEPHRYILQGRTSMRSIAIELVVITGIAFMLGGMCSTIIHTANASHGYTGCNRHG